MQLKNSSVIFVKAFFVDLDKSSSKRVNDVTEEGSLVPFVFVQLSILKLDLDIIIFMYFSVYLFIFKWISK